MPQHIYELPFVERYQKAIPQLRGDTSTAAVTIQGKTCEFALLRTTKRVQYFVRVQEVHTTSSEISLTLLPESLEEIDFLNALKEWKGTDIALAYRDQAAWGVPQSVAETSSGWEIVLEKSREQGRHHETKFGELTGDQLAELRAKRILLNQKLGVASPWLFEYRVRNGISQQYKNGLVVHESPIPQLYLAFQETPEQFLKFARLVSVLFLKLTHTVEDILQLKLELQESAEFPGHSNGENHRYPRYQKMQKGIALKVRFKGRRHQYFPIRDATILEFEGICPLIDEHKPENDSEPLWR